eukprot:g30381.t1
MQDSYRVQSRTELFDHLLAQDLEEFEKQTARVMANKASPMVMDSMPLMVTSMDLFNTSDSLAEHFEFLDQQPKIFPGTYDGPVEGHVVFEDVSFAYPTRPEQKVLHGLSMELQPGKTTALVGASGSGKSTTVQLIFRYYDPFEGTIFIDGVPLKDWELTHLHRHMALVAQEPVLFNTSVRQNLLYGLPQILVLDEATSALDAESEAIVQEALDRLVASSGSSVMVIAHRLSTVRQADPCFRLRGCWVVARARR